MPEKDEKKEKAEKIKKALELIEKKHVELPKDLETDTSQADQRAQKARNIAEQIKRRKHLT